MKEIVEQQIEILAIRETGNKSKLIMNIHYWLFWQKLNQNVTKEENISENFDLQIFIYSILFPSN